MKITFGIATKITLKERRDYFYECIESIISQTNDNWEIIISDDCSTIDVDWERYHGNNKIKIYHQKVSLGIFKNFNFCLNKTKTEWFLPLGDDDLLESDFVQKAINKIEEFENKRLDLICFNYHNIRSNGNIYFTSKLKFELVEKGVESLNQSFKTLYSGGDQKMFFCSLVKTDSLLELGGYPDYGMVTDIFLVYLFSLKFNGIVLEDPIIKIRQHNNNASGVRKIDQLRHEQSKLNELIKKDFFDKLNNENKKIFEEHNKSLLSDHVNLLIVFKNFGRIKGLKCFLANNITFRHIIILILGIIFGNKIHKYLTIGSETFNRFKLYFT